MFEFDFYYDADGSSGGGGSPAPEQPPATPPTGGGQQPGQSGGENLQLTSAQLAERLDRARGAERTALLKTLGYDSVEALQTAILEGQRAREAQMTEQEHQTQSLQAAQQRAQELEQQAQTAQRQAQQATIRAEAIALMAGRFANPQQAFRLLDMSAVKVGDDGKVGGLKEAVEQLATTDPWTLAQPGKKQVAPPIGPTNPEGNGERKETDAEKRSRFFGDFAGGSGFFQPREGGVRVNNKQ